jgi:hypothetical protein
MAELIVNIEGYGDYTLSLDLHDPGETEVWSATFADDYEVWDLIDVAIETYRDEYTPNENQD